jgi:FkbM family methyltransferase
MNDSTSNLYNDSDKPEEYYLVDTITLESIITNYQINPSEIGLIKVDIEGSEEFILLDLINYAELYNLELYNNKNKFNNLYKLKNAVLPDIFIL